MGITPEKTTQTQCITKQKSLFQPVGATLRYYGPQRRPLCLEQKAGIYILLSLSEASGGGLFNRQ